MGPVVPLDVGPLLGDASRSFGVMLRIVDIAVRISMHAFLYTAPRYHTNQHYPASSLLESGHDVTFLVLRRGNSETYDAVEPVVLGTSRVVRSSSSRSIVHTGCRL